MNRARFALFFVLAALPVALPAQQNVFESGNGDGSLFLSGRASVVSYNLGDSTARLGYVHDAGQQNYFHHLAYGLGAGGTVDNKLAALINKNSPAPGGFAEGALLFKTLFAKPAGQGIPQSDTVLNPAPPKCATPPCPTAPPPPPAHTYDRDTGLSTDGLILQFHYARTQFYLLPTAATPIATPAKTNFDQFRATIAYNQLRHYANGDWTIGLAAQPGTANNLSTLTQDTYQTQVVTTTSSTQSILASKSQTVYVGAYSTYLSFPINADLVFQPKLFNFLIGFDALLRSELGGGPTNRFASPGVGAYFFRSGSPVVPVGGVTFCYKQGKSQIAVVVGWTFGGTSTTPIAPAKP